MVTNFTSKILKDYRLQKALYEEFAVALVSLMESMLTEGEYKYYISYRVKEIESLGKKIERKKLKGKIYKKLNDVQDIAGIRIIFYTQSDRKKFEKKLKKEFENTLLIEKREKVSGYRATHAFLSLDEARLKLIEYKNFKGLECELQLSLILEHAWAEIEHDILYKDDWGFKQLDKIHYLDIKERMGRIMKNYIEKAGEELERIVLQFKKIKREKELK